MHLFLSPYKENTVIWTSKERELTVLICIFVVVYKIGRQINEIQNGRIHRQIIIVNFNKLADSDFRIKKLTYILLLLNYRTCLIRHTLG